MIEPLYYNEYIYNNTFLSNKKVTKKINPIKEELEEEETIHTTLLNPTEEINNVTEEINKVTEEIKMDKDNINKQFILNPLSVIIKLSILSCKPIGTKIHIENNVVYFQEPGIFQSLTRYIFKSNKSHLQYLYYPIKIACKKYLTKEFIEAYPKINHVFSSAKNGIENLMKTYSSCAITILCLKYYHVIISSYLNLNLNQSKEKDDFFYKETDSCSLNIGYLNDLYTDKLQEKLENQWKSSKLNIILDLLDFLLNSNDENKINNIKSLEPILNNNDQETYKIITTTTF
jgi:hypothetical protein